MKGFKINKISKDIANGLLQKHHYLSKESKGFRSGFNYGAFNDGKLVAVCIFHSPSVPETMKGCFGLGRSEQDGFYELGRLCVDPNHSVKNLLSWFVSISIRLLRKEVKVKAILSYADSRYHTGFVYQASNFGYYGLTSSKKDFWFELGDGSFKKHSRGTVKGLKGEWRPRPRKHRYLLVYDKGLQIKWVKEPYPKKGNNAPLNKKPTD